MNKLLKLGKNKISLEEIEKIYKCEIYSELYSVVCSLVDDGIIKPIKASKTNGKRPTLYNRYSVQLQEKDDGKYTNELKYKLDLKISPEYYIKNPSEYVKDRDMVLYLDRYLRDQNYNKEALSINERSFQIWGREKYLQKEGGVSLLKKVGLNIGDLNIYETEVPLAYYTNTKQTPQNILIVENKDTFYSMRKYLIKGNTKICGVDIGTLIYGAGKQVIKGYKSFIELGEPYIRENNTILYFGDLDYEGISIYESLLKSSEYSEEIKIFANGYKNMIDKSRVIKVGLPDTKENQHKIDIKHFLSNFDEEYCKQIEEILESRKYIPQEILNLLDF